MKIETEVEKVPTGPNHFLNKKINKQFKNNKIGKKLIKFDNKIINNSINL